MSERGPRLEITDIERRPELDPGRKVERPPIENYIQIVNIYRSRFDDKLLPWVQESFSRRPVSEILAIARVYGRSLRQRSNMSEEYLGTIVQHKDHQALKHRAI